MSQQNTFHIETLQKSLFEGYKMIRIVEFPDFLEDIGISFLIICTIQTIPRNFLFLTRHLRFLQKVLTQG